jgi:hypothetical protein
MTYSLAAASAGPVFSHAHITVTAAITGAAALAVAWWRLPRPAWIDIAAMGVLAAASVFLWRASANMPQLNSDGLPGFSAADWLAPVITCLFLALYAQARPPADLRRYGQASALAIIASLVVNVITI